MPEQSERPPQAQRIVVVVVEPDVLVRMAISDYLRQCGYTVVECRSAEEVLRVLDAGRPVDIVFSEVALPEMSGFELAKCLRARDSSIGVILTYGAEGAAEKAGDLCDGGPIAKPYQHEEVVRRIRRLREGRERPNG
jgi:DNA-binding response OmpR family regulator